MVVEATPVGLLLGILILAGIVWLATRWLYHQSWITTTLEEIDELTGHQFERYLNHYFRSQGYWVKETSKSGDYGVDLLLFKSEKKIAVQAKRYRGKVSASAVRNFIGALPFYDCDEGLFITNSYFTKPAQHQARKAKISLIDRTSLAKMVLKNKYRS